MNYKNKLIKCQKGKNSSNITMMIKTRINLKVEVAVKMKIAIKKVIVDQVRIARIIKNKKGNIKVS
jgi:hypothetical protein